MCAPKIRQLAAAGWGGRLTAEKVDVRSQTASLGDTTHGVAGDDDENHHCNLMMIIRGKGETHRATPPTKTIQVNAQKQGHLFSVLRFRGIRK